MLDAGYYVYDWVSLGQDYSDLLRRGTAGYLLQRYQQSSVGDDNGFAVYNAVQCTDAPFPGQWSTWRADTERVAATAPFLTWSNTWYNAPCLTWGAPTAPTKPVINGQDTPPVLLVSETYDAATPFAGALQARATFPRSVLIEGVKGTTHAGSLSGVSCVDNRIADYLLTGKLDVRVSGPSSDVKCPKVPAPAPAAALSRGSAVRTDRLPPDLRSALELVPGRR